MLLLCSILLSQTSALVASQALIRRDSSNPCTYPTPMDENFVQICQVTTAVTEDYLICDPDSAMSISESMSRSRMFEGTVVQLNHLNQNYGNHCICNALLFPPCWYRLGVAVVQKFEQSLPLLRSNFRASTYCNQSKRVDLHSSTAEISKWSTQMLTRHGQRFADVIRHRWNFGLCGEDILILVVKNKPHVSVPPGLTPASAVSNDLYFTIFEKTACSWQHSDMRHSNAFQMLFLSAGLTVQERAERLKALDYYSLDQIVHKHNENLENGFPLKAVLESIINELGAMLLLADQKIATSNKKGRIPSWAVAAFGTCAGLLVLMALGLLLIRRRERGAFKRGQSKDKTDRRWKAGFVGGMYKVSQRSSFSEGGGISSGDFDKKSSSAIKQSFLVEAAHSSQSKKSSDRRRTVAQ
ncbi:hypothetical protein D918_01168 [Trichuris suis]|nr:hypothetical protein D918_01168 [Trichuris suis]